MTEQPDGANLSASTFDLDAWIDDISRAEVTVTLHPNDAMFMRRLRDLEQRMAKAEKASGDLGLDDETTATIQAEFDALRAERDAEGVDVRLREITKAEAVLAVAKVKPANRDVTPDEALDATISAMTVAPGYDGPLDADEVPPHFTPQQLRRMRRRGPQGEAMYFQLVEASNGLTQGLPTPS